FEVGGELGIRLAALGHLLHDRIDVLVGGDDAFDLLVGQGDLLHRGWLAGRRRRRHLLLALRWGHLLALRKRAVGGQSRYGGGETDNAERDGNGTNELTHGRAPRAGGTFLS